jgi:hypothetical protein
MGPDGVEAATCGSHGYGPGWDAVYKADRHGVSGYVELALNSQEEGIEVPGDNES